MFQSLFRQPLYAPFQLLQKLREHAAMQRHRNLAALGAGVKILSDGWVVNPHGPEKIRVGDNSVIRGELLVFPHGGRIDIGAWCFIGHGSFIWSAAAITIGDRCLISHGVNIHDTDSHSIDPQLRHEQFAAIASRGLPNHAPDVRAAPISIADDVWIGFNASILKGVSVGRGAIVGAGSLVNRNVEPWSIVAGNPARVIGKLDPRP